MATREEHDRLWAEVVRLRDRVHELSGFIQAIGFKVDRANGRLDVLEPRVEALAEADLIAEGVAEKLATNDQLAESKWRRWGIRVGIAGAVLAGVGELAALGHSIGAW